MPKIKIDYDGKYPNLCRGKLIVTIDDKKYTFSEYCLSSGGEAYFTKRLDQALESVEKTAEEDHNKMTALEYLEMIGQEDLEKEAEDGYAEEHVNEGPWDITDWPPKFPKKYKQLVIDAVNDQVEHGCCGGCL